MIEKQRERLEVRLRLVETQHAGLLLARNSLVLAGAESDSSLRCGVRINRLTFIDRTLDRVRNERQELMLALHGYTLQDAGLGQVQTAATTPN